MCRDSVNGVAKRKRCREIDPKNDKKKENGRTTKLHYFHVNSNVNMLCYW